MNILNQVAMHLQSPRIVWLITIVALVVLAIAGGAAEVGSCGAGGC